VSSLRRDVCFFSAANFFQVATNLTGLVAYPRFLTSTCGLGEAGAGALVGVLAVASFVAVLPLGLLSDRVSPKRLLQACQLLTALFHVLLTVVRTEWLLLPLFVLGGVGLVGSRSLLPVIYYKYLPEERRSSNVSMFLAMGFFGVGVGGSLGSLAQAHSVRLPFYLAAGTATLLALWTGLLPDAKPEKMHWLEYIGGIVNPRVFALLVVFILTGLHFGVEQYGLPKLIADGLGIAEMRMGGFYLSVGVCLGGVGILFRKFLERRPKHFYYFGVGLVVSGVLHGLTFLASDFTTLMVVRLAHVVGDAVVIIMTGIVVAGIFPGARMGGSVGFANLVNTIGQFAGAFLAGFCIDVCRAPQGSPMSPYVAAFTISGIIVAACGVAFLVFRRKLGVAERDHAGEHA
jgi:MFS family permease